MNTFKIEKSIPDSFKQALRINKNNELNKGFTLMGPHRDNFEIKLTQNGITAKKFASQGQRRVFSLLLKLCMAESYELRQGLIPILLLDDVLLELDYEKRSRFIDKVIHKYQVFFTASSLDIFPKISGVNIIKIKNGASSQVNLTLNK